VEPRPANGTSGCGARAARGIFYAAIVQSLKASGGSGPAFTQDCDAVDSGIQAPPIFRSEERLSIAERIVIVSEGPRPVSSSRARNVVVDLRHTQRDPQCPLHVDTGLRARFGPCPLPAQSGPPA
jgi:hypothetical protein